MSKKPPPLTQDQLNEMKQDQMEKQKQMLEEKMRRLENQMKRKKERAEKLQDNVKQEIIMDPEFHKDKNQLQSHIKDHNNKVQIAKIAI